MINHARTLLLNRSRESLQCGIEEYVPGDFVPTLLPAYLQNAWEILFGTSPEKWCLNWRANQYMQILHSTEWESYVLTMDKRIAYPVPSRVLQITLPMTAVEQNSAASEVVLKGTPTDDPGAGRMAQAYTISVSGGQLALQHMGTGTTWTEAIVDDGSFTADILLRGSGVRASFRLPVDPTSQWLVETIALSTLNLPDMVDKLKKLRHEYAVNLFEPRNREPFKSFYRLWSDSRGFATQLTGFLLAWLYQHHRYRYGT